jgi:hypothetical protein
MSFADAADVLRGARFDSIGHRSAGFLFVFFFFFLIFAFEATNFLLCLQRDRERHLTVNGMDLARDTWWRLRLQDLLVAIPSTF